MVKIGIDPSSKFTGWAVINDSSYISSGVIDYNLKAIRREKNNDIKHGKKLIVLKDQLQKLFSRYKADIVILEDVLFKVGRNAGSLNTVRVLSYYFACVLTFCVEHNLKLQIQRPGDTRVNLGLPYQCGKPELIEHTLKLVPEYVSELVKTDDEVDAIALALSYKE